MTLTKKFAALAVACQTFAAVPALAFNEAAVTEIDIGRVAAIVAEIADEGLRTDAQHLVFQAQSSIGTDEDTYFAFKALNGALELAKAGQVADMAAR